MKDGRIYIQGIAAREGISKNNRKYTSKELKKFAPTLIGRPILRDHESLTTNVIGKVTHAESIDGGKIVTYKGWVKGAEDIERIKDGRISEVSIGAISKRVVKEDKDDDFVIPIDMSAMELSTTPTPGIDGTSMTISNDQNEKYNEENLKEMINNYTIENLDYKEDEDEDTDEQEDWDDNNSKENSQSLEKNDKIINKKEENMKTEDNAISTKENVELETAQEKLKVLEAEKEESEKAQESLNKENKALKETLRKDAISKYEEKANSKGAKILDLSKSNMEAINFAIEMVDSMPEPKAEEPAEEGEKDEEEPKAEEPAKEEPKEKVKLRTKETNSNVPSVTESLKGYTLTQEDCGRGFAFYKNY